MESDPKAPVRVAEILANCTSYLGKEVEVAGYLGACGGYDCHLYADKAGMAAWGRYFGAITRPSARVAGAKEPADPSMGVGFTSENWERKAQPLQSSYVVISGRMDKDSCDGRGGTDRSPGINPQDIRIWTPAEGAPLN